MRYPLSLIHILKLIASSNPHIRNNEDTRSIMLDVIIALCPALIMSVIRFGYGGWRKR